ncbi:MAG: cytochrome P450 [Novosphingobium sp.]
MATLLLADDPLYEELYDVRREAIAMRNYVEHDQTHAIAALRAQAPVHKGKLRELLGLPEHERYGHEPGQRYCALSYDACEEVLRDSKRFSSSISRHPNPANEKTMGVLEMDGGEHRAYRRALQSVFLQHNAETWWRTKWIDGAVEQLIGQLKGRGRADLNLDFCARIPVHTITTAIGLDGEAALEFRMAWLKSGGIGRVPPEEQRAAAQQVERMLLDLVERRRAVPQDDVITKLIEAELALPGEPVRPLTDREVMLNARLIMIAGGGTSWRQMGIALLGLLSNPDQFADVRADRALLPVAVEESARWCANSGVFARLVTADTTLGGVDLPEGSVVELWLNAANRDPARWENPERFNLHRPVQNHLGFGIGQHRCLGLNVARQEMVVGIGALMDAFPALRLDPDVAVPFITGGLEQRGVSGLRVVLG